MSSKIGGDINAERSSTLNRDSLYIKLPVYKRRKQEAFCIIEKALNMCEEKHQSVSCSWGKDSIVMLDMVLNLNPKIKIMFINQGTEYPETLKLKDYYINNGYNVNEVFPDIQIDKYYERRATGEQMPDFHQSIFFSGIKKFTKKYSIKLQFIGLRKNESKGRLYTFKKFGHIYKCKYDDIIHVNPLFNFTASDIWGYIYENNIKYAELYDKTKFLNRDEIRNCPFGEFHGWTEGTIMHLKYYYYEEYLKLRSIYDKLNCYI